jgi:hypothetical protein
MSKPNSTASQAHLWILTALASAAVAVVRVANRSARANFIMLSGIGDFIAMI